ENAKLTLEPSDISLYAGESATLDCNVEGSFRSCYWEHDGKIYPLVYVESGHHQNIRAVSNRTHAKCSIHIITVRTSHAGQWNCNIITSGQNITASMTLTIENSILRSNESEHLLYVGQDATLLCDISEVTRSCYWKHSKYIYHVTFNHIYYIVLLFYF
ncbi:unnamed protein product, partial [Meganyctiphanes norvegica]